MTITTTRTPSKASRRDIVRSLVGRKTPDEIRDWAASADGRTWALPLADRLATSGYLTLADVTDSEFDEILG